MFTLDVIIVDMKHKRRNVGRDIPDGGRKDDDDDDLLIFHSGARELSSNLIATTTTRVCPK